MVQAQISDNRVYTQRQFVFLHLVNLQIYVQCIRISPRLSTTTYRVFFKQPWERFSRFSGYNGYHIWQARSRDQNRKKPKTQMVYSFDY